MLNFANEALDSPKVSPVRKGKNIEHAKVRKAIRNFAQKYGPVEEHIRRNDRSDSMPIFESA